MSLLLLFGESGEGDPGPSGTPIGLLLALTGGPGPSGPGPSGEGTPIGLLLALTRTTGEVPPEPEPGPPFEIAGGGRIYGRGFPRKRYDELLAALEAERQAALERANAFRSKQERARAKKAARLASQAIARAKQAADEAAMVAHVRAVTQLLEGAAEASNLANYLEQIEAARREAEDWIDEDEVEIVLLLS